MPTYKYVASSIQGKTRKGVAEAADEAALKDSLSKEGLFLVSCETSIKEFAVRRLRSNELADFCRQLGSMLSAGVTLIRAISILLQRDLKPQIRASYSDISISLQRGLSLSEAMEKQGAFPDLLVNAFRASESSGQMDKTCMRMAEHYEKEYRTNGKIKSAMAYPLFLLCLTVVIMVVIFSVVLPRFFTLFEGIELPGITKAVIAISNAMSDYGGIIIIVILLAVLGFMALFRVPKVALWLDRTKLRFPIIGKLLKIIYTARFARTLSSLYASGLTIINALQNTKNTIGNKYIASQFDDLIKNVRNGENLSTSINAVDGFDKKLSATISIGEETGNLDFMLDSIASSFDYESEQAMSRLTAIIEPVMIIFMAIIVCLLLISVMLPILTLYNSIGSGYGV